MFILLKIKKRKDKLKIQPNWFIFGLTTLATLTFLFLVYVPLRHPDFNIEKWAVAYISKPNFVYWVLIIYNNLFHAAMLEELMFRFFIMNKLEDFQVKPWLAILIQSFLFCIAHVGRGGVVYLAGGFFLAVILGVSVTLSKRINIAIFNHVLFNVLNVSIQAFLVYGTQ